MTLLVLAGPSRQSSPEIYPNDPTSHPFPPSIGIFWSPSEVLLDTSSEVLVALAWFGASRVISQTRDHWLFSQLGSCCTGPGRGSGRQVCPPVTLAHPRSLPALGQTRCQGVRSRRRGWWLGSLSFVCCDNPEGWWVHFRDSFLAPTSHLQVHIRQIIPGTLLVCD